MQGLMDRKKELDTEVYRLRKFFLNSDPYGAMKEGFLEKKQELTQLEALSYNVFLRLQVYDSLLAKYSVLANGLKRKGRYPSQCVPYDFTLERASK
jgi:hypothetical protein